MSDLALRVDGLTAGYGISDALRGISLEVPRGQITAVIGPNGAGKSTLMKCLAGIHRPTAGKVELCGEDVSATDARGRLRAGLSLCPERRRIFQGMTVEENLLVGAVTLAPRVARRRLRQAYERFQWLAERRSSLGGNLSGGQQQMLAICRAIMTEPKLLLLDEPSLGLAPRVVLEVADLVREHISDHMTVFIVEQNVSLGLDLADWVHVLNRGEVIRSGSATEVRRDGDLVAAYLG